jgi:oxygen-independent coproporphyrinogen-3 oxidase
MIATRNRISFDPELIRRYDLRAPRYTSYPSADHFENNFTEKHYRQAAVTSNEIPIPRALSLYFHIPFCNSLCFFCACNKVVTRRTEVADEYLDYLCQEIQLQGGLYDNDREVVQLHLGGGTPTFLTMNQIKRLLQKVDQHFLLSTSPDRDFSIEIDPRTVALESLESLRQLGFNRISLGVQDFEPKVQQAIHRIQPAEATLELLQYAKDIGFESINVDLIYGLPHQTFETFNRTLELLMTAPPDRLSVFNYAHLPCRFPPQRRIHGKDLPSAEEKLTILETCVHWLTTAGYSYIGIDHFARPEDPLAHAQLNGTLGRNFQGYSTHTGCDQVGLGISSISQVGACYSQNVKELSPYYAATNHGRLSVDRGFQLSPDDEIRRRVIEQLMCFSRVNLNSVLASSENTPETYFAGEFRVLEEMIDDGLLSIDDNNTIEVSPSGRFLIRSICKVFDIYSAPGRESRYSRLI